MSAPDSAQRARELLGSQLTGLNELRNASARDAGFKAWRQATLTVIQRVWPNDPSRAERFRRVPFSAPSSKMSVAITRSFYEKGCAEAVKLLRDYISEAATSTLLESEAEAGREGFAPGMTEDDFPVLELHDDSAGAATVAHETTIERDTRDTPPAFEAAPAPPAAEPVAGDAAGFVTEPVEAPPTPEARDEVRDAQRALDAAIDAMGARPRPVTRTPKPSREVREREAREREAARAPKPPRRDRHRPPARNPLKDMLGFTDSPEPAPVLEPPRAAEAPAPPAPRATEPPAPAPPPERAPLSLVPAPPAETIRHAEPVGDAVVEFDLDDDPFAPPSDEERTALADASPRSGGRSDRVPEPGFFRPPSAAVEPTSAAAAEPGVPAPSPAWPARGATAAPSAAGASLAALAGEVAQLGVPEGHRAAARAELLDLARRFDSPHTLTWESLRGVISFVLEYPALARRVLPMLIPYLDLAA